MNPTMDSYIISLILLSLTIVIDGRKPQIDSFKPTVSVEQSESFQLMCSILSGSKPIRFEWYRNGQKLSERSNNDGISVDSKPTSSILYVDRILLKHSGNYSCRAINQDGADVSSTIVQIKGLFHCPFRFDCLLSQSLTVWRLRC